MRTATLLLALSTLHPITWAAEIPKGSLELITTGTDGAAANDHSTNPAISGNGKVIAFATSSSSFGAENFNGHRQILSFKPKSQSIAAISRTLDGELGDAPCSASRLSKSGRHVAFESNSSLGLDGVLSGPSRVFWRDTKTGKLEIVSVGPSSALANDHSYVDSISDDGRFVLFHTNSNNMVKGEIAILNRGYLHNTKTGTSELVTVNQDDLPLTGDASGLVMSGNGRFIFFTSAASNLGNGNKYQVYVRDRKLGTTTLLSKDSAGLPASSATVVFDCSRNGRFVLMSTSALDLAPPWQAGGLVLLDRKTSKMRSLDLQREGTTNGTYVHSATISNDGRRLFLVAQYEAEGSKMSVPGVFEFDLKSGENWVVMSNPGSTLSFSSFEIRATPKADWVVIATNLDISESNGMLDGYLYRAH